MFIYLIFYNLPLFFPVENVMFLVYFLFVIYASSMKKNLSYFFGVVCKSQTYLNILYLLIVFPLGIFYFVVLVTWISLWAGLIITLFGLPLLWGMIFLWREFGAFERRFAKVILKMSIVYVPLQAQKNLWKKIKVYLGDGYTRKSLAYLFIKFPLGIFSFVLVVTLLALSLGLVATPIMYHLIHVGIVDGSMCNSSFFCINSYFSASVVSIVGIILIFISLHIFNGFVRISGLLTKYMLRKTQ